MSIDADGISIPVDALDISVGGAGFLVDREVKLSVGQISIMSIKPPVGKVNNLEVEILYTVEHGQRIKIGSRFTKVHDKPVNIKWLAALIEVIRQQENEKVEGTDKEVAEL